MERDGKAFQVYNSKRRRLTRLPAARLYASQIVEQLNRRPVINRIPLDRFAEPEEIAGPGVTSPTGVSSVGDCCPTATSTERSSAVPATATVAV